MKAALLILSVCLLLTIAVTALVAGLGYVPGLSKLIGLGKPPDLGVTYSEADYISAQDKLSQSMSGTGNKPQILTDGELSALFNACSNFGCPFQAMQIKTSTEAGFELSGYIDKRQLLDFAEKNQANDPDTQQVLQYLNYLPAQIPFYAEAVITGKDDVLSFVLNTAQVATISIPSSWLLSLNAEVTAGLNKYLASLPGTQIESFDIGPSGVMIDGDLRLLKLTP